MTYTVEQRDEIDLRRAAWFRATLYFREDGLVDRRTIWKSWCDHCSTINADCGSKRQLWIWLIKIGVVYHGYLFRRIKFRL
jgi:hypothetical protein